MVRTPRKFNFYTPTQYNHDAKSRFHATVKQRFRLLASYHTSPSIYSNMGGIAISGEVYFKTHNFAIEASQPCSIFDSGLRIFRLNPEDRNYFAPLDYLNNVPLLADHLDRFLNYRPHPFAVAPVQLPLLSQMRSVA